jgi:hypothetical protein
MLRSEYTQQPSIIHVKECADGVVRRYCHRKAE